MTLPKTPENYYQEIGRVEKINAIDAAYRR